jgi:hypothetical protein
MLEVSPSMGAKEKYTVPYLPVYELHRCAASIAEKAAAVKIFFRCSQIIHQMAKRSGIIN